MESSPQSGAPPLTTCLAPHAGLFFGFAVAWLAAALAGHAAFDAPTMSGRLMSLTLSLMSWSVLTLFQGKRIYGGGTLQRQPADEHEERLSLFLYIGLGFAIALLYSTHHYWKSFGLSLVLLVLIGGELVRGKKLGLLVYGEQRE